MYAVRYIYIGIYYVVMGVENITVGIYCCCSSSPWSNYVSCYRTLSITLVITVSADSRAVGLYFIGFFVRFTPHRPFENSKNIVDCNT